MSQLKRLVGGWVNGQVQIFWPLLLSYFSKFRNLNCNVSSMVQYAHIYNFHKKKHIIEQWFQIYYLMNNGRNPQIFKSILIIGGLLEGLLLKLENRPLLLLDENVVSNPTCPHPLIKNIRSSEGMESVIPHWIEFWPVLINMYKTTLYFWNLCTIHTAKVIIQNNNILLWGFGTT